MEPIVRQIEDNINEFVDDIKQQLEHYVSRLAYQFADELKTRLFEGIHEYITQAEDRLSRQKQDLARSRQTIRPAQSAHLPLAETSQIALLKAELGDLRQRLREVSEVNAYALLQISREIETMQRRGSDSPYQRLDLRVRALEDVVRNLQYK